MKRRILFISIALVLPCSLSTFAQVPDRIMEAPQVCKFVDFILPTDGIFYLYVDQNNGNVGRAYVEAEQYLKAYSEGKLFWALFSLRSLNPEQFDAIFLSYGLRFNDSFKPLILQPVMRH